ncbi:hypothetical protein SAMN05216353_13923 [Halobacillus alkaliphilus]|uniref:Uncharacterized protein n=1 Tax=Halobacillus alkaliphilus TaxID=396056 RepID=A0A1I2RE64_9BACI|nr:hypothetical protein [Halobacillus alkaliphilus]SFG38780.1 hypothetical protein SAMN05216353_13923 [Halobacillus alkaliphilus]
MKGLKEGSVMIIAGMLAALVVSIFFYSRGSGDYTPLVFIVAFIIFVGSGLLVKVCYLWIQWGNRYLTNVLVYMLCGAIILFLLTYIPSVYSIIFESYTFQELITSSSVQGVLQIMGYGAICGLLFYHCYIGVHSLVLKFENS